MKNSTIPSIEGSLRPEWRANLFKKINIVAKGKKKRQRQASHYATMPLEPKERLHLHPLDLQNIEPRTKNKTQKKLPIRSYQNELSCQGAQVPRFGRSGKSLISYFLRSKKRSSLSYTHTVYLQYGLGDFNPGSWVSAQYGTLEDLSTYSILHWHSNIMLYPF